MDKILLGEQEKFRAVFQNASLGILVIDNNGTIILANEFLLRLFEYTDENDLKGKKMEMLLPQRYRREHVGDRQHFSRRPTTRPMGMGRDLFGITKSGKELPLEISLSSYENMDGVFSIAFISDITSRVEVQNKLREQGEELAAINRKIEALNEELEKKVEARTARLKETLQKLENSKDELFKALSKEKDLGDLKSAFVSLASHEFRTPLSTILSSAILIGKYTHTEEQPKRDKHIQRIKSAVLNLNNILDEFLSLKKIEEGRVSSNNSVFDIEVLIENQISEMAEIFKRDQLVKYVHHGVKEVTLDKVLFKNILINLLSNASKFSPEGKQIYLASTVANGALHFVIEDEGIGISEKDQQHLFEMFFRASNASNISGTGLGLHIVSKYVETMGGTIDIKSNPGRGTRITLTFLQ